MGDTVKKQHYVWRGYLTRWTDNGERFKGKVFVLRKVLRGNQESIEFRELEKIGYEKYYYDVTGFQERDVIVLKRFLLHLQRKELFRFGIDSEVFNKAAEERDFIEKKIMCSYEDIDNRWKFLDKLSKGDFSFYKNSTGQNILDELRKCMLNSILYQKNNISKEELLSKVNEFFKEGMEEDDLKYEFHRFFCMQYFRSPRVHNSLATNFEELKKEKQELKDLDTSFYVNMVLVYFAERMAINLTQNFSTSILIYENKTDVPFVTGDTPIVNLSGTKMDEMTIFHYPISPHIAIQLMVTHKFSEMSEVNSNICMPLEQQFVSVIRNLNQKLADNCVNEIYSNDRECLNGIDISNLE